MSAKKTAIYHQELAVDDKVLTVLAENGDGTVNLGHELPKSEEHPEGGVQLIVGRCPVNTTSEAKEGTCTIQGEKPKEAPKDK